MMKHVLWAFFLSAVIVSCTHEKEANPGSFDFETETSFRPGDEYVSGIHSLKFTISEISDSRCPSDVICIWQGKAAITIDVELPVVGSLRLSTFDNQKDTLGRYSFELVKVEPYPVSTKIIKPEDYEITLKIEALE